MPQDKRARWHDYRDPGIYMLTFRKNEQIAPLGTLHRDTSRPYNDPGAVTVRGSDDGLYVVAMLGRIGRYIPSGQLLQFALMPDHVHVLLRVHARLPMPLGTHLAAFKHALRARDGQTPIFEEGFNDKILLHNRSLDQLYQYIRENPYRLMIRREHPEFFARVRQLRIGDQDYDAYGNLFLLKNPFKLPVIVHRKDSEAEHQKHTAEWLELAADGGVLVSAFISAREREVRQLAEDAGGKLIVVRHEPFGERFKPSAHDSDLCIKGLLLILVPCTPSSDTLTRSACLRLNDLATKIAEL